MKDRITQILNSRNFFFNGNVSVFARTIGMEQTTVNNYILGKRKMSLEFICKILSACPNISADWLLRGKGEMLISERNNMENSNNVYSIVGNNSKELIASIMMQISKKDEQLAKKDEQLAEKDEQIRRKDEQINHLFGMFK